MMHEKILLRKLDAAEHEARFYKRAFKILLAILVAIFCWSLLSYGVDKQIKEYDTTVATWLAS